MSRLFFASVLIICFGSCNNKEDSSPWNGLLSSPPYTLLSDSIKKNPKDADLYFRRAVLLNGNNETEPALADFRAAWMFGKNEKSAVGISNILLDKNPDSAIAFIRSSLQTLPQSFLLRLSLIRALDAKNSTDEALAVCNTILGENPDQVDILKLKAGLLDKKSDSAQALQVLQKAYTLTPFDIELNYMLALKLAEAKNPAVINLCDSLARRDSAGTHAEPYYYKGIYYSNIHNAGAALTQFNEAIKHDYYFLDAYIEKGAVYYDQKKYSDALKVFQLANTLSPALPDAYYWMGKTQEATGDRDNAVLNYQKALGLDKNFTEAQAGIDRLKK
jgi:tetratricopeptide (TPR) repeat protein